MRASIDIDDALTAKAMAASEAKTEEGAVERARLLFVKIQGQKTA